MPSPTERFSTRVENYIRYRPTYPPEVLAILAREIGLVPTWAIADLGSGTGISAELFLKNGNTVIGVEPNAPMREAAERLLAHYKNFQSVNGAAEATTLPAASVDCVVAAQAFHWFDAASARAEARRILKPGGWAVLLWNSRRLAGTPFLEAYEQFLATFGTDYQKIRHENVAAAQLQTFFGGPYEERTTPNAQRLDHAGLRGRILSSSYMPNEGDDRYDEMMVDLVDLFAANQTDGVATLHYDVEIYWARLG